MEPIQIVFDDLGADLSYRRWSRIRRIQSALRSIRRNHPQIKFTFTRHDTVIEVTFLRQFDLLQFSLISHYNLPEWKKL